MKKINNHFIEKKKGFESGLRDNGRGVIDLFERNLAKRNGYELLQQNSHSQDFIK